MCACYMPAPGGLFHGLLSCLATVETNTVLWTTLLGVLFFFAFVFSKWFNILLQCSYTFSSASFALVFPCPFPPILLLWWWQLLVFLSRDTKQCSFLVICIFCVPPCCLFFSPSLTCVKDASSYARVFTDNILHVCVYSKWQKKKRIYECCA